MKLRIKVKSRVNKCKTWKIVKFNLNFLEYLITKELIKQEESKLLFK